MTALAHTVKWFAPDDRRWDVLYYRPDGSFVGTERWLFRCIHRVGDTFVRNYRTFQVVDQMIIDHDIHMVVAAL